MEVIICQSDRSPERLMISHTPSMGETWNQLRWEKECGGNSQLLGEFCKTLSSQNGIFITFQNCGILGLPHLCICNYYRYGSEKLYSTVHVCGSSNWSMWEAPWKVDDISDPWHGGNIKSAQVGERVWWKLSKLLGWVFQNPSFWKQDIPNLPKLWHFGPSTFLYLSVLQPG